MFLKKRNQKINYKKKNLTHKQKEILKVGNMIKLKQIIKVKSIKKKEEIKKNLMISMNKKIYPL
jgi:hypothetical protein